MKNFKRCILIDDDIDDREVFELAIEQAKIPVECISFKNGIDALRLISDPLVMVDYIFLDVHMSPMSGMDCLIEIRKFDHLKAVPVYIYTNSDFQKHKEEFTEKGVVEFIKKPSKMAVIISMVKSILSS